MNNNRTIWIVLFVFLLFIALVAKLFDIQILKSEELKYLAERQQTSVQKIRADRGLIFDRNNVLLVYNRNDISFYLDLRMVSEKAKIKIADTLSAVFDKSKKHYLNLMKQSGKTICVEKKAPSEKALLLKDFKAAGFFSREDPTRVYHYGSLAAHLLGYVNSEYEGLNGIARTYDEELSGEDGARLVEKDAIGDMITVAEKQTKPAVAGNNIYLTINKSYQVILEEELKKGLSEYGGSSAVGIIMDPNNGEVLALANMNDYDPNRYWDFSDEARRDKAVTDTYEPGSTFKTITMSALLDEKLCRENETVFVENGRYKYKSVSINDSHDHSWLSVKGVFEQSSNIGMAKLVQRIDDDDFYKYIRGFGFGNYTTIDLPGEVKGTLKKPNAWGSLTKAFMSFGYQITVTPIQLISAYSAVINGGILYRPQIVKREVLDDGSVIKNSPNQIRRVISEQTSEKMREFLQGVVEKGTGKNAKLEKISTGGKTGTSQKLIDGSYSKSQYNSSFVGFFPVENPKVVCLVLVNAPKIGRYGGAVAAPIFKNVAERIISSDINLFRKPVQLDQQNKEAVKVIFTKNSKDEKKIRQDVNPEERKILKKNIMPDLSNFSLRDAIQTLTKMGVDYKVKGSGLISSQSILPGTKIKKGTVCILKCEEVAINGTSVY